MMDAKGRNIIGQSGSTVESEEEMVGDLRRGPWTVEEDFKLINYIANNGEGRWNSLARCAGLRRTGKSCRLRWLNYLRPDVRRGNITLEEQLMILELHSRWGNRWSKIAQYLPGRTDNEIKNYWRTRVQKHAKQLKCDVNSKQFKDTMKYIWMPRLIEKIQAAEGYTSDAAATVTTNTATTSTANQQHLIGKAAADMGGSGHMIMAPGASFGNGHHHFGVTHVTPTYTSENSSTAASSDSFGAQVSPVSDLTSDYYNIPVNQNPGHDYFQSGSIVSPSGHFGHQGLDFQSMEQNNQYWLDGGEAMDNLWNAEDIWLLQQQLSSSNM